MMRPASALCAKQEKGHLDRTDKSVNIQTNNRREAVDRASTRTPHGIKKLCCRSSTQRSGRAQVCAHNNLGPSSIIRTTGFEEATIVCLTYHAQFSAPHILNPSLTTSGSEVGLWWASGN